MDLFVGTLIILYTLCILHMGKYGQVTASETTLLSEGTTMTTTKPLTSEPNLVSGHKNIWSSNATVGNMTKDESQTTSMCTFSVDQISIDDFVFYASTKKFNFAYLKFSFNGTDQISMSENAFRPYNWVWTFRTDAGVEPFLHWSQAYRVLSLGVLDSFTINRYIKFHVSPKNCKVVLGDKVTSEGISAAFGNILIQNLSQVLSDYNHSIWCYEEIYPTLIQLPDVLAHTLAIHNKDVGYRCCRHRFNQTTRLRSTACYDYLKTHSFLTYTLHYILAVVVLLYCPIWLCNYAHSMSPKTMPLTSEEIARSSTLNFNLADDVTWLYLGKRSPVPLSSIFIGTFGCFKQKSPVTSRLNRVIFVLLSPSLMYIRLILFYYMGYDYIKDSTEKSLPTGFLSMLFGFKASQRVMFYLVGGPYVVYGIYMVAGSVLICLPKNFPGMISAVLLEPVVNVVTPLKLNLGILEKLGSISCLQKKHYKLVRNVMKANFFMIVNPQFWKLSVEIQINRFTEFWNICNGIPKFTTNAMMCLSAVVYIPICLIEFTLSIIYYTCPIIFFSVLVIRSYIRFLMTFKSNSSLEQSEKLSKSIRCAVAVVMTILLIYILCAFCTLFVASVAFFIGVLTFFFIGVVAYPTVTVGYFTFAITNIYYIWSTIRSLDMGYMDLFKNTIEVSKKLQKEKNAARNGSDVNETCPYVKVCGGRQGIPKDLFEDVIRKHRPFRLHVFTSLLKLVVICSFIITAVSIINAFNKFHEIHMIISVASIVLICSIPGLISLISADDKQATEEEFKRKLGKTISEYWRKKDRQQLKSICAQDC